MPESLIFSNVQVRRYGFGLREDAPLYLFTKDTEIKQHSAYTAAKAGDITAAMQLISDLALSFIYDHRHQFSRNHIFVAPHAREASGDNAIPQVLAEVCALVSGAKADTDIVQTTRVFIPVQTPWNAWDYGHSLKAMLFHWANTFLSMMCAALAAHWQN